MPTSRSIKVGLAVVGVAALAFAGRQGQRYYKKNLAAPRAGEAVYRQDCMSCHGPVGEGVAGKSDEPLVGEKSVAALAKYIAREMPEDDPGTLSMADATAVAEHIHQAFYSAEARARNHPPRIELAHLTVRQYRESIADLLGSLRGASGTTESGGLAAVYRERPERDPKKPDRNRPEVTFKKQVDPVIDFDFGADAPEQGTYAAQFSINWTGSVLAPDTGEYEFRVTSPNGVRFYVNPPEGGNEKNALIDLWVSSGMSRSAHASVFLLGGRSYPIKVEFFKFKDKTAGLKLEWRPPGGDWTVVPRAHLSPSWSSHVNVVSVPLPPDDGSIGYERGSSVSREWTEAEHARADHRGDLQRALGDGFGPFPRDGRTTLIADAAVIGRQRHRDDVDMGRPSRRKVRARDHGPVAAGRTPLELQGGGLVLVLEELDLDGVTATAEQEDGGMR
ncbi:MAG: PA14 domain-containing protein, partial [Verrucomicrobiota bacterium]